MAVFLRVAAATIGVASKHSGEANIYRVRPEGRSSAKKPTRSLLLGAKSAYKRNGHRQPFTEVKIESIG